jgi:hypothetical protein
LERRKSSETGNIGLEAAALPAKMARINVAGVVPCRQSTSTAVTVKLTNGAVLRIRLDASVDYFDGNLGERILVVVAYLRAMFKEDLCNNAGVLDRAE